MPPKDHSRGEGKAPAAGSTRPTARRMLSALSSSSGKRESTASSNNPTVFSSAHPIAHARSEGNTDSLGGPPIMPFLSRPASPSSLLAGISNPFVSRPGTPSSSAGLGDVATGSSINSPGTSAEFDFLPKSAIRGADVPKPSRSFKPAPLLSHFKSVPSSSKDTIPASPSQERWEHLRQAVLPSHRSTSSISSDAPLTAPVAPAVPPSKSRWGIPKPTSFRAVVDQARGQTAAPPLAPVPSTPQAERTSAELYAFAREIQEGCWTARHGPDVPLAAGSAADTGPARRGGKTGHSAGASASFGTALQNLMQGAGASSAASMVAPALDNTLRTRNKTAVRGARRHGKPVPPRPPPPPARPPRRPPTVAALHNTLVSTATSASAAQIPGIPGEADVLGALLSTFFPPRETLGLADDEIPPPTAAEQAVREDEQAMALEAFEIANQTWPPADGDSALARALWACDVASILPPGAPARGRALGALYAVLLPPRSQFTGASAPRGLNALLRALHGAARAFSHADPQAEEALLTELARNVRNPTFSTLDRDAVEEQLGAPCGPEEDLTRLRKIIVQGATIGFLADAGRDMLDWTLDAEIEDDWSRPLESAPTLLTQRAMLQNHQVFLGAAIRIVNSMDLATESPDLGRSEYDERRQRIGDARSCQTLLHLIQRRLLPELRLAVDDVEGAAAVRAHVVRLLIGMIAVAELDEPRQAHAEARPTEEAVQLLINLLNDDTWKPAFQAGVDIIVIGEHEDWEVVNPVLCALVQKMPEKAVGIYMPPLLNSMFRRLVVEPPSEDCPIGGLLRHIALTYAPHFFQPLILLAGATMEASVVRHLRTLAVLERLVPDLWTCSANLMSSMLADEIKKGNEPETKSTRGRLGRTVALIEMLKRLRKMRDMQVGGKELSRSLLDFVVQLEGLVTNKLLKDERWKTIHASQRVLYIALFLEVRLIKAPKLDQYKVPNQGGKDNTGDTPFEEESRLPFLPIVVGWATNALDERADGDFSYYDGLAIGEDDELGDTLQRAEAVFAAVKEQLPATTDQRRSAAGLAPNVAATLAGSATAATVAAFFKDAFTGRQELIKDLGKGVAALALPLLVATSGLLRPGDLSALLRVIWDRVLDDRNISVVIPACFLVMQGGDKIPDILSDMVTSDLTSPDSEMRRKALGRLETLYSYRLQILSQEYIPVAKDQPAFQSTSSTRNFIPTNIGTSRFVRVEDPNDFRTSDGTQIPMVYVRLFRDMGWSHEGDKADPRREIQRTPISLLPVQHYITLEGLAVHGRVDLSVLERPPSPDSQQEPQKPSGQLLRRRSSASAHADRRRMIFVRALVDILPMVADMIFDADPSVANAARQFLLYVMKEDPYLLGRPVFDHILGSEEEQKRAFKTLNAYIHVARTLPPVMAHHTLNHLTGLLRYLHERQEPRALAIYARVMVVIAPLARQVSEISVKQFRRPRVEQFLLPEFGLWALRTELKGVMVPRLLQDSAPPGVDAMPDSLRFITMIRAAQNIMLHGMIQRNGEEVYVVRQGASRLVLPTLEGGTSPLPMRQDECVPVIHSTVATARTMAEVSVENLSLHLSRSYVLLVTQIFRSLPPRLSGWSELEVFVEGLCRVLITHPRNVLLVTNVLSALLIAVRRYKLLFTPSAHGGYNCILPAVLKVYVECLNDEDLDESVHAPYRFNPIRHAVEYAVGRFYAFHDVKFIFDLFVVLSNTIKLPDYPVDWAAVRLFQLLRALDRGPPSTDPSGIIRTNRETERQFELAEAAHETPAVFFASTMRWRGKAKRAAPKGVNQPIFYNEHEVVRFKLDNVVKFFATYITVYNGILLGEQLLHLFRVLAPYLALVEGKNALLENAIIVLASNAHAHVAAAATDDRQDLLQGYDAPPVISAPSNATAMKMEMLLMAANFSQHRRPLASTAMGSLFGLIAQMANVGTDQQRRTLSDIVGKLVRAYLVRISGATMPKDCAKTLGEYAKHVEQLEHALDLTDVFVALADILGQSALIQDAQVLRVLVERYSPLGLRVCAFLAERSLSPGPTTAAVVDFVMRILPTSGTKVLDQIMEDRYATPGFFMNFLLPFLCKYQTKQASSGPSLAEATLRRQAGQQSMSFQLSATDSDWERLLNHILHAAKASMEATSSVDPDEMHAAALQVLKVIIIRAEKNIKGKRHGSSSHAEQWINLENFLRNGLEQGSFDFMLPSKTTLGPSLASPGISSPHGPTSSRPWSPMRQDSAESRRRSRQLNPRLVDYYLASWFQVIVEAGSGLKGTFKLMPAPDSEQDARVKGLADALQAHMVEPSVLLSLGMNTSGWAASALASDAASLKSPPAFSPGSASIAVVSPSPPTSPFASPRSPSRNTGSGYFLPPGAVKMPKMRPGSFSALGFQLPGQLKAGAASPTVSLGHRASTASTPPLSSPSRSPHASFVSPRLGSPSHSPHTSFVPPRLGSPSHSPHTSFISPPLGSPSRSPHTSFVSPSPNASPRFTASSLPLVTEPERLPGWQSSTPGRVRHDIRHLGPASRSPSPPSETESEDDVAGMGMNMPIRREAFIERTRLAARMFVRRTYIEPMFTQEVDDNDGYRRTTRRIRRSISELLEEVMADTRLLQLELDAHRPQKHEEAPQKRKGSN